MNVCREANKFQKIKNFILVPNSDKLVVDKCSRVSRKPLQNLSRWLESSNFRNLFPIRIYLEPIIIPRYLRPWNCRNSCDSDVIISSITNIFKGPLNKSFQTSIHMDQYKRYRTISCVNTAQIWLKLLCLVPNGGVKFVSVTLEARRSFWFCKFQTA